MNQRLMYKKLKGLTVRGKGFPHESWRISFTLNTITRIYIHW
jgi:hypothetical protein